MAFIRVQKLVRDESGQIRSGSASILESTYGDFGNYHSQQHVVEKLGKVLYLSDNKKVGIFLSPTRGLVEYNSVSGEFTEVAKDDPRIAGSDLYPDPQIHTIFGDVYFLLCFLITSGIIGVLRQAFPDKLQYERLLCHICHGLLRDGSHISCDDFIERSFASYIFDSIPLVSLKSDTIFFSFMGTDRSKVSFFIAFCKFMRTRNSGFGKACYVDSTPLPNDIVDNPFNALCSHGVEGTAVMMRLVLVLDEESGLPVWYDIIPGNVLDINTLMQTSQDVFATLGVEIIRFVLDAGYVSKELITKLCSPESDKTFIGRMPAKKGYPHKECYRDTKGQFDRGKYTFMRNGHLYYGKQLEKTIFGVKCFVYVYVDKYNALKRLSDYLVEHEDEFEELKDKDKDWQAVKGGFFILISNENKTPKDMLIDYYGRTDIEGVFKTAKEYLQLLPISKWTDLTVRGKILHDIIDTIILLMLRKKLLGNDKGMSLTSIFGKVSSIMCCCHSDGNVTVEIPNKQAREIYSMLDLKAPASLKLSEYKAVVGPQ